MAPNYDLARLEGGPLAGDVIQVPLRAGYPLPEARIGVPVPVLDEARETLSWDTATYLFPSVQAIPRRRGQLWRYTYVSTAHGLPDPVGE
jgi:hypothetical protein